MSNDRDVLRGFLAEHLGYVDETAGAVVAVGLTHHAHAGDVVVHSLTSVRGGAAWGNTETMADVLDAVARRHAAGIAGAGSSAQQFTLSIVRANSNGKPTATIPFVRMSPASMTGPGGSLATEAATATGAQGQGMRLLEVIAQGTFAERGQLVGAMAQLISELRTDNRALLAGSLDQLNAMRGFVADVLEKDYKNRIDLLRFNRNTHLLMRAVDVAPMMLGAHVPEAMADASFAETFLDLSDEDLAAQVEKWQAKSPAKAAVMIKHLTAIRKRRAESAAEMQRLKSDAKTPTMDEAAAEIGGLDEPARDRTAEVIGAIRGKTNGEAARKEPEIDAAIDKRAPHGLTKPQAREFVEGMAAMLGEKVPLKVAWQSDRLVIRATEGLAQGLTGWIDVDDVELRARVALPGLKLRAFQSMIEGELDAALERLIERAKAQTATANGGQ